eukprot:6196160-Pleurochrysis_carterae.AAC.2
MQIKNTVAPQAAICAKQSAIRISKAAYLELGVTLTDSSTMSTSPNKTASALAPTGRRRLARRKSIELTLRFRRISGRR